MRALPARQFEQLYILYTEFYQTKGDEINITKNKLFPVNLKFYHGDVNKSGQIYDYYEVNIGTKNIKDLSEQRRAFDRFAPPHYVYVIDNLDEIDGATDKFAPQFTLNSADFLRPEFPHNGLATAFHERCHIVRKRIQGASLYQRQYLQLEEAFETLDALNSKDIRRSNSNPTPVFDLIRESYYFVPKNKRPLNRDTGRLEKEYGHPQDDANETFASGATVLRFFTDKFIAEYNKLSGERKVAMSNTVQAILAVFDTIAESESEVRAIFPDYKRIADLVGYRLRVRK